jgi:predicted acetyltransferase
MELGNAMDDVTCQMKEITAPNYRDDEYYPKVVRAVGEILSSSEVVAPVDVFVHLKLLSKTDLESWRFGRVPYLEKVICCDLGTTSHILRILRLHLHDLNMIPSHTAYVTWGNGPRAPLRFSKTGEPKLEAAYSRRFLKPGLKPKKRMANKQALGEGGKVTLDAATSSDAEVLANLLLLYILPNVDVGTDDRFSYPKLPLYWSESERRFAFLLRCDGRLAGFVLVKRGSPAAEDPEVLDIIEFFVLRRHRRSGVGRQAAFLLWNRFPGKWTVRVSLGNPVALAFWQSVIAELTSGTATEFEIPGQPNAWRVFSFESAAV